MEKLLEGRLNQDVELPIHLGFDCPDRNQLVDQLKVLRNVLRKENGNKMDVQLANNQSPNSQSQQTVQKRLPEPSTSSTTPKKHKEAPKAQESRNESTIFEQYNACSSQKAREEFRRQIIEKMKSQGETIPHLVPLGQFDLKYALSSPYNVFLPCVQREKATFNQPYSITFPEILDISLGEIVESLHINFMVDVGWLCLQYLFAGQKPNSLILLGERCDNSPLPPTIQTIKIETPSNWGTHHSKISIFKYKDEGARIIISTANLYADDWENRTQALWMSPHLPKISENDDYFTGESKTGFKADFIAYLRFYQKPSLESWIIMFQGLDFSSINVFFVASVPGTYKGIDQDRWGLGKLRNILSKHAELPFDGAKWPVIAQASSIGSLGPNYGAWLSQEFIPVMSSEKFRGIRSAPNFQFIYPSLNNYKDSFDKEVGSCCLPYGMRTHQKQLWLLNYLYQWKSTAKGRDRAMPHSKIYTRISPDFKKIPWVVVTSANLSKAAWGYGKASKSIFNYEAGVVFIPEYVIGEKVFPIVEDNENGMMPFPLPYDVPLTTYDGLDGAFVMDFFQR